MLNAFPWKPQRGTLPPMSFPVAGAHLSVVSLVSYYPQIYLHRHWGRGIGPQCNPIYPSMVQQGTWDCAQCLSKLLRK